jgi:hypothetical protein
MQEIVLVAFSVVDATDLRFNSPTGASATALRIFRNDILEYFLRFRVDKFHNIISVHEWNLIQCLEDILYVD